MKFLPLAIAAFMAGLTSMFVQTASAYAPVKDAAAAPLEPAEFILEARESGEEATLLRSCRFGPPSKESISAFETVFALVNLSTSQYRHCQRPILNALRCSKKAWRASVLPKL